MLASGDGAARRTKADWAVEVADLLEGRYADCPRVTFVLDNLNTHTPGAFYEVFEPSRARELVRRLEFCYTPKHGSWLNMSAWSIDANGTQRGVDWQMQVDDARRKLKSVYPTILM